MVTDLADCVTYLYWLATTFTLCPHSTLKSYTPSSNVEMGDPSTSPSTAEMDDPFVSLSTAEMDGPFVTPSATEMEQSKMLNSEPGQVEKTNDRDFETEHRLVNRPYCSFRGYC